MILIDNIDAPGDSPDDIGIEGVMKYFGDINVKLDEVVCLAVAEMLKSPSMGEFKREDFVNGWKLVKYVCYPVYFFLRVTPLHRAQSVTTLSR